MHDNDESLTSSIIDNSTPKISDTLVALSESEVDLLRVVNIAAATCKELSSIPCTDRHHLEVLSTELLTTLQRIRVNLVGIIESVKVVDPESTVTTIPKGNSAAAGVEEAHLKELLDQLE